MNEPKPVKPNKFIVYTNLTVKTIIKTMFFVEIEEIMDENPDLKMQVFRRLSTGGGSVRSTNSQARLVTCLPSFI